MDVFGEPLNYTERPTHAEQLLGVLKSGKLGAVKQGCMRIAIAREQFSDYYTVITDDKAADFPTEELDEIELICWLEDIGLSEDVVYKAKDQAWNFGKAIVTIANPVVNKIDDNPLIPKLKT